MAPTKPTLRGLRDIAPLELVAEGDELPVPLAEPDVTVAESTGVAEVAGKADPADLISNGSDCA